MLEDMLEYIAKKLVSNPDKVAVSSTENDGTVSLKLTVASEDMGMVIGRHGRIAKEIRTLIKAVGFKNGQHVILEIAE